MSAARAIPLERGLQVLDGVDLAVAQTRGVQVRQPVQAPPERIGLRGPLPHRLRPREAEHLAGTRYRVAAVGEARHLAGALVDERQRFGVVHPFEHRRRVGVRLALHVRDLVPPLAPLRLDHADRLALNEQHVVRRPHVGRILAHRDPGSGAEVDLRHRLDAPSSLLQLGVDGGARPLFGGTDVVGHCCCIMVRGGTVLGVPLRLVGQ